MQFIKKTSSRTTIIGILIKFGFALIIILGAIFFLNKIDLITNLTILVLPELVFSLNCI
jgi:hypothetical protein